MTPKRIPLRVGNRVVAYVQGDTLFKFVHGQKHMLRTPKAWAFDVSVVRQAQSFGAVKVVITDEDDDHKVYHTTIAELWRLGFPLSRGFGKQIALPLDKWHTDEDEQMSLFEE